MPTLFTKVFVSPIVFQCNLLVSFVNRAIFFVPQTAGPQYFGFQHLRGSYSFNSLTICCSVFIAFKCVNRAFSRFTIFGYVHLAFQYVLGNRHTVPCKQIMPNAHFSLLLSLSAALSIAFRAIELFVVVLSSMSLLLLPKRKC